MNITIRSARPDDAEALTRLADTLNRSVGFEAEGFTADVARADGFGPHPAFRTIVAAGDRGLVGYALYTVAYETGWGARGAFLADLYVAPPARRRGIARRLMAAVARETAGNGACYMWWLAGEENAAALALYRGLGIREERNIECLLDRGAFAALAAAAERADGDPD